MLSLTLESEQHADGAAEGLAGVCDEWQRDDLVDDLCSGQFVAGVLRVRVHDRRGALQFRQQQQPDVRAGARQTPTHRWILQPVFRWVIYPQPVLKTVAPKKKPRVSRLSYQTVRDPLALLFIVFRSGF